MPSKFEFNDRLLAYLSHHTYSSKFGSFLFDCHKERSEKKVDHETISAWLEVDMRKESDFKNPYCQGAESLTIYTRIPTTDFVKLRVWKEFFMRF